VYLDPEVLRHDSVRGRHPDRVGEASDPELFGRKDAMTVPLVKRPERASDDPVGRRWAAQQTLAGRG
jgi:hypothetical protein